MSLSDDREYSLIEVLTAKHYPQVYRVTRPHFANRRECLWKGQIITVLGRKKVNLIVGIDREGREFYIRKDHSTNVEVVEDERIVYNLSLLVPLMKQINGIEFRKELRFDKQTFGVGEVFSIEKVNRSFKGRNKSIALRREKDSKVYRFPLDMIGMFRLLRGRNVSPLAKVIEEKVMPISVLFRNTPTSSNYPRGKVKLREVISCDIVYVLSVNSDMYTYEAFLADPNIYVEKCRLSLPKPILKIIPNSILVCSPEFVHPIKGFYRQKINEVDSKLTEDIYALTYYGSATFDKPPGEDTQLVNNKYKYHSSLPPDAKTMPLSPNAAYSPGSEQSGAPPLPYPRYSKKPKTNRPLSFPAILESEQSIQNGNSNVSLSSSDITVKRMANVTTNIDELKKENPLKGVESGAIYARRNFHKSSDALAANSPKSGLNVVNKAASCTSLEKQGQSERIPNTYLDTASLSGSREGVQKIPSPRRSTGVYDRGKSSRVYDSRGFLRANESPNATTTHFHSRSSSIATEDSGDSGVILSFNNNWSSPGSSRLSSPATEESPLYSSVVKNAFQLENYAPPIPERDAIYQNIHHLLVDIDIGDGVNHNNNTSHGSTAVESFDDLIESSCDQTIKESSYEDVSGRKSSSSRASSRSSSVLSISTPMLTKIKYSSRANEILAMTQGDVGKLLAKLKLHSFIDRFARELINGQLLKELDEKTLIHDLKMTQFQARKIFKYVLGWRPILEEFPEKELDNSFSNPVFWSINKVFVELQKINLSKLAHFCKDNLVDGPLLKDLVEHDFISTLKKDHGISLSGIEFSRLQAFILKEWRPDDDLSTYNSAADSDVPVKSRSVKIHKFLWNRLMPQNTA